MTIDKLNDGKPKGKMTKADKRGVAKVLAISALTHYAMRALTKASKEASVQLSDDIAKILDTYKEKGGFETREEALSYLSGYVKPKDIDILIERARNLEEPYRTRELTRLSSPAYAYRMSRKKAIDEAQRIESRILESKYNDVLKDTGKKVMEESAARTAYDTSVEMGVGIDFTLPNMEAVDQTLRGEGVYDKVKLFTKEEMVEVKRICTKGFLDGHPYKDVAKDVEAFTGKETYKCVRLVRTTMAQASVDASMDELKDLGIEEYEVHCTLDERTCDICGQYDGKTYPVGSSSPCPTFHPNCRCYVSSVRPKDGKLRAARDERGKSIKVPATMSYSDWVEKFGSESAKQRLSMKMKKF